MAGVKGNKNAVGNRGGGRKSAYQELADALDAAAIFFSEHNQAELEAKIQSGSFSIRDRFVLNAMEGSSAEVLKAFHKAVPDKVDVTTKGEKLPTPIYGGLSIQGHDSSQEAVLPQKED